VPVIANLYGPEDNFDLEDSDVIAAMIHKYVLAEMPLEEGLRRIVESFRAGLAVG